MHAFLNGTRNVRAVTLHVDDECGSACGMCVWAAAAVGGGGPAEPPALRSHAAALIDTAYGQLVMMAVRKQQQYAFSASYVVVGTLETARLTGAPLQALYLSCIPDLAWEAVVAPLLGHHARTLRELALVGYPDECMPSVTKVGRVVIAADGGLPVLLTLFLTAVRFDRADAAAVAAACRVLTSLAVDGTIGDGGGPALSAPALPALTRLSWRGTSDLLADGGVAALLAGRSLDAAAMGHHGRGSEALATLEPVLAALDAAATLPVGLDLFTARTFDNDSRPYGRHIVQRVAAGTAAGGCWCGRDSFASSTPTACGTSQPPTLLPRAPAS